MKHRMTARSAALIASAIVAAGALSACSPDPEPTDNPVVKVTLNNHPWSDALVKLIPEFEKETGLTVEVSTYSTDQLLDLYNVKLNAGTDEIDVMMYQPAVVGTLFERNEWLTDLTDRVTSDPEWDWSDFQKTAQDTVSSNGAIWGVPLLSETEILYYRKDLLQAAGLDVPTTLEELENAAKVVSEQNPGVSGFVGRGQRSGAVSQFASYLYSFGADWNDKGTATIDTPEAIAAYEYYGGLLRKYGPAGTTSMNWQEAMAVFTQGLAAFYTDASVLYPNAIDPATSTVVDQVGFAAFPAGPAGSRPFNLPAWALGINPTSTNADNAWRFISWATSKDIVLALQQQGVAGPRTSAWENPDGLSAFPADLAEAMFAGQENGVGHYFPPVVQIGEARDIIGAPLIAAIEGGDVAAAAAEANAALQDLLDREYQG